MGFDVELSIDEDRFHGSYTIPVLYGIYEILPKVYLGKFYVYGEYENRKGKSKVRDGDVMSINDNMKFI